MRRSLAGLRCLVTGASSGIGRALTLRLIQADAKVAAVARRKERLDDLAREVAALGRGEHLRCLTADVTSSADRAAALALCEREFGGLDALVNNAGVGGIGPFAEADEARLRKIFEVNLIGPVELTRAALPLLRRGRTPLIVNVGSVLGHRAVPSKSEYCASKFALHGWSDALRAELAKEGIDVLLVSPSTTQSEFFEQAGGKLPKRNLGGSPMTADAVARRIVGAMRAGRHEIILSVGGKLLVWLDRLCPPLVNRIVAWLG